MTHKELKRLNRSELLELLLAQTQEVERLQLELEATRQQLEDRRLRLERIGNLAQAAIEVSGVLEAAQKAANLYLDNIAAMEAETRRKCDQTLSYVEQEARKLLEVPEIQPE